MNSKNNIKVNNLKKNYFLLNYIDKILIIKMNFLIKIKKKEVEKQNLDKNFPIKKIVNRD